MPSLIVNDTAWDYISCPAYSSSVRVRSARPDATLPAIGKPYISATHGC